MASQNAQVLALLQQILTNQGTMMSQVTDAKTAVETLATAVQQLVAAYTAGQVNNDPTALAAIMTVAGQATAAIAAVLPPPAA